MMVSVIYFDEKANAYCGRGYTYKTNLPLKVFQKVICPTYKGDKKAIVMEVDLPDTAVDPAWSNKLKEITKLDEGDKG